MKRVGWFIFGYVLLLAASLPYLIPPVPRTKLGWIVLIVLAPPGYHGEWFAAKISEPWGERTLLRKALKATILVIVTLMLIIVAGVLRV